MENKQNTQNDIQRKTPLEQAIIKVKKTALIVAAVSIVLIIVGFILTEFELEIGLVPFVLGFIVLIAIAIGTPMVIKQTKNGHCKNCGEKYEYDRDVSWVEEEEIRKEGAVVSVVRFTCHCDNCDDIREFTKKFTVASYNQQKNSWSYSNLENLCRKYFKPFNFFS